MCNAQAEASSHLLKTFIETFLLNGHTVSTQDNLLLSGQVDSLGVMSLVAFIEETFELKIPFEDVVIENFMSIETMAAYVDGRQSDG